MCLVLGDDGGLRQSVQVLCGDYGVVLEGRNK